MISPHQEEKSSVSKSRRHCFIIYWQFTYYKNDFRFKILSIVTIQIWFLTKEPGFVKYFKKTCDKTKLIKLIRYKFERLFIQANIDRKSLFIQAKVNKIVQQVRFSYSGVNSGSVPIYYNMEYCLQFIWKNIVIKFV